MKTALEEKKVLLNIHNIGVLRGSRWLIRGIDLKVRAGEIVTIIGPNGAGKSTTAKVATGIINPDEGTVTRAVNLRIGYVPQTLLINGSMPLTVRRLLELSSKSSPTLISNCLERVGIVKLIDSQVNVLSGGEFRRVMFARALLRNPQLLVLDEPVGGVDFSGSLALYQLISKIRDETGCGVLLISHDLHMVMAQTDSVVCLNSQVCCRGTPELVAENPEYLKLFGKGAAQELAIYKHSHEHSDGAGVNQTGIDHSGCDHD